MRDTLKSRFPVFILAAFLLACVPLSGLAAEFTDAEKAHFLKAVEDASKKSTPARVSRKLLAIVPPPGWTGTWPDDPVNRERLHGGAIHWEGVPGQSRVKVAAFMSRSDYETYYKASIGTEYTLRKSLWVTVVPELRNYFIGNASCPPTPKRIMKLLGLNPWKSYDVVVEMYVDSRDLFRPSPDPEITDHRAEPAVKAADGSWEFPDPFIRYSTEKLYVNGPTSQSVSFPDWFKQNAIDSYDVSHESWCVPWTRLGYTYDWAWGANRVGASEFIIRVHPDSSGTGGVVQVKLIRAIRSYDETDSPANWNGYFRCK